MVKCCIVCGNSSRYKIHTVKEMMYGLHDEFTYFECLYCGCLQLIDIPDSLGSYYPKDYYSINSEKKISEIIKHIFIREQLRYSLFNQGILGRLADIMCRSLEGDLLKQNKIKRDWNILDIGCGSGSWLFSLSELGFSYLYGIEPFIESDVKLGPIEIKKGTIHNLDDSRKYNLIRSNHSFEHIPDQYETLIKIRKLLKPNGICIISMPIKTDFIWNRYGTNWVQIDAPRHIVIHTLSSFSTMVKKVDLEIVDTVFNSTDFQFWGSEQYVRNIPLYPEISSSKSSNKCFSFFKEAKRNYQMRSSQLKLSGQLNREKQGDQAIFVLKTKKE